MNLDTIFEKDAKIVKIIYEKLKEETENVMVLLRKQELE